MNIEYTIIVFHNKEDKNFLNLRKQNLDIVKNPIHYNTINLFIDNREFCIKFIENRTYDFQEINYINTTNIDDIIDYLLFS